MESDLIQDEEIRRLVLSGEQHVHNVEKVEVNLHMSITYVTFKRKTEERRTKSVTMTSKTPTIS